MVADTDSSLALCLQSGRLEKLQRMRWCITEGINLDFPSPGMPSAPMMPPHFPGRFSSTTGDGLLPTPFFGPVPPALQSSPLPGTNFIPAGFMGSTCQQQSFARGRGVTSKRPVSGLGGTLEVAGVPIAQWGGNKAGRGYSEKNRIIVGGPTSVELGHSRGQRRGRGATRGRQGGTGARSVTWAMDVDQEYDRNIGYRQQQIQQKKKTTNISQVREGGDGGNEVTMVTRERGDGANDIESHNGDAIATGQGILVVQPTVPQPSPVGFNSQAYSVPLSDVTQPAEAVLDVTPVILTKTADSMAGLGRGHGHGTALGGTEQPPVGVPDDHVAKPGGRGRGWWWDKQVKQQQSPPP